MVLKLDPFGSEDGGTFAAHPDAIRLLYGDAQYSFHALFRQTFGDKRTTKRVGVRRRTEVRVKEDAAHLDQARAYERPMPDTLGGQRRTTSCDL